MKVLVTGGAGFIGSHIVDAYRGLGHEVVVLDNLSTGRASNVPPGVRLLRVDLRDAEGVRSALAGERCEVLSHHAAQIDVRRSVADPAYDASVNLVGFLHLIQAGLEAGLRKVIFASSGGAIYGEQERFPADETHPTRPISPYGIAKLATEHYLYYYRVVHGLDFISLRYANVYGPRQNPEGEAGVVCIFTTRMLRNEQALINGDGGQTRDYVYVGDVVRANVLALDASGSDCFNVGTGVETDVQTLFRALRRLTGAAMEERHAPAKQGEQRRSLLDPAKLERARGWRPSVTLEEGLRATVEHFRREL
ncbi:MAG: NAD-dependent epimerase/dehydratase family protein [Bacteroidota bacterium]